MLRESRFTMAGESSDAWGAACGTCEKNTSMLFLDKASAKIFCFPRMCVAMNQKSNFAAKKTRRQMRCIMYNSLLYVDLISSSILPHYPLQTAELRYNSKAS